MSDPNPSSAEFHKLSHEAHERFYESEEAQRLAQTWEKPDTGDAWRHARMYASLNPILAHAIGARWITLGDGRYASDAHYLEQHGAVVVATDISDTMLQRAKNAGFIHEYQRENAEHLSFPDNSFDFALCKESYHHFPRPMLALYEMLRVARRAVALIEPDESPVFMGWSHLLRMTVKQMLISAGLRRFLRTRSTEVIDYGCNWYEEAGNFGYSISRREIERVALGLNYPHVAFRGINDVYIDGVENEPAIDSSPIFSEVRRQIAEAEGRCKTGLSRSRHSLLVAIIFKEELDPRLRSALEAAEFDVRDLTRNPYLASERAA